MIYLDNGATSLHKPQSVTQAIVRAMRLCGNPGRGGHRAAMLAAETVFNCRDVVGDFFQCQPENVVFTANCTHGLNIAINSLIRPGDTVVISGFEHNAVVRPLYAKGANIVIAGRKLFDKTDMLNAFEDALKKGADAAVFTHVSNVFGYILPVEEIAQLCRKYCVPFIVDAAQSAGAMQIQFQNLGAKFIAMPGHKGLLGPMGTGILLCNDITKPLLYGGTGNISKSRQMPESLPERLEAGTLNVPGIAGLCEGIRYLKKIGVDSIGRKEREQVKRCVKGLIQYGFRTFFGEEQLATISFVPKCDCEDFAEQLSGHGIAVRSGLHCAPIAHESAGTLDTGTVRISFGHDASSAQTDFLLKTIGNIMKS